MTDYQSAVHPGMEVLGSEGSRIGAVKSADETSFLVDRSLARDIHVPYGAVERIEGNAVILTTGEEEASNMGWESPPQLGSSPPGQPPIQQGMAVVGSDGDPLGTVKEIHDTTFRVDRPMAGDVEVPYNAVQNVLVNRVVLTVPVAQVDFMRWTGANEE